MPHLSKKMFFFAVFSVAIAMAQVPASCFEIESILVDACGNPEGENEMVRFRVGASPLTVANLNVSWPNNSFLGICQNASTASKVSQINSTITACGLLLEPSGGILPPSAEVILVTSVNFSTSANSFANLSDTLYIIFQCAGNTTGHFANATGVGNRTLTMSFGPGCSDVVTYNCQQLVDINGNVGTSGPSTDRDGATANFTWAGTATYTNIGCNAPIVPQILDAGTGNGYCQGDTIQLNGTVAGAFSSISWSGGSGVWINGNTQDPQYVVSSSDVGSLTFTLTGINCNGSVTDQVTYTINPLPVLNLSPSGAISLCAGDTIQLVASGGGPYLWSTGSSASSIQVTNTGIYSVTSSNSCGSVTQTATITSGSVPVAQVNPSGNPVICGSSNLVLTASGGVNYVWSTGATGSSITINSPGWYGVMVSNGCGSDTTSVNVAGLPMPSVNITNGSSVSICQGSSAILEATGTGNIDWPGITTDSVWMVTYAGTFVASSANSCGTAYDTVQVTALVAASIQMPDTLVLCQGQSLQVSPVYIGTLLWNTGSSATPLNINAPGNYYAVASNTCGTDTAFLYVAGSWVNAGFTVDSLSGQAPLAVQFTNTSAGASSYHWDFNDGGSSTDADPAYTFFHPGSYSVLLTASNTYGCQDTASLTITVNACDNKVFIPNAFTPNLDDINGTFYVVNNCAFRSQVTVFDRWGKEVYSWTDLSQGWNGSDMAGDALPIGTYVYLFEFQDVNGNHFKYRGMINLLR